jgi:phosphoenolpyruvate-protein phosphotransferase (PTS system enzyme I)
MENKPLRLSGTPASSGLARGPLFLLDDTVHLRSAQGSPEDEAANFRAALADAAAELTDLIARTEDADAQAILEFQVAMLEDDVLTGPAFTAIARGTRADEAWQNAMEAQIREYHEADDLYFRARAADLRDMRERVLRCLTNESTVAVPEGAIVVAADMPPSRFLEISWNGGGLALFDCSPNSHVAMLARARGVPMIVDMSRASLAGHVEGLLDAENGVLLVSPNPVAAAEFATRQQAAESAQNADSVYLDRPALTAAGERVQVMINIADVADLEHLDPAHCDGIGLVRTELMLKNMTDLEDEEKQFAAYRNIVEWAQGRPVTFRTLDAGGDKPIAGYTIAGETNPFLGVRGVRLSLRHPHVLTTQLRALARAAAHGELKIMVPMVTRPGEMDQVRSLLEKAVDQLKLKRVPCALPKLGMMVEVPAAAIAADLFDADFFSIGSNDLIQYITACSRDSAQLGMLQDPLQPAVLRLIRSVVQHGLKTGNEVSLCGDMGSDLHCLPALLGTGLRCVSIAPAALGRVKAAVARYGADKRE